MNAIRIRKATISDLENIRDISEQTFIETFAASNTAKNIDKYIRDTINTTQLAKEINHPESVFYLATKGTQTIGYMKLNFGKDQTKLHNSNSMEIQRIYILKMFLGKKIGQVLLNEAIKIGQQAGVDSIWLGVWEKNQKAIEFYNKNNFTQFDTYSFTLGDDIQTDLLMELRIINLANYL